MKESKEVIPGYVTDKKGILARFDEEGTWRLLDTDDQGHLIALNTFTIMQRALNRARVMNNNARRTV